MYCLFINLDSSVDRRALVERNFSAVPHQGWTLQRVQAIEASAASKTPGSLRDAEKGCFLSHQSAVERSATLGAHVLVAEDDIRFGRNTFSMLGKIIDDLPRDEWDILYPEIGVLDARLMVELFLLRRRLSKERQYLLMDLKQVPFFSATSYVVNQASLERLSSLLSIDRLDVPYDIFLRHAIWQGKLKSKAIFPFATSVSMAADASTVQSHYTSTREVVSHAFRRLVWAERSLGEVTAELEGLSREFFDADATALCRILQVLLSERFPWK